MERMKVIGKQEMNFDTKDGNHVEGIKLHCTKDAPNHHWTGQGYEGIFISVRSDCYESAVKLPIGSDIDVTFNRYGKADSFFVCK